MRDKYCVIGNPIAHSKSPDIHAAFAAETGQDISYERCLAPQLVPGAAPHAVLLRDERVDDVRLDAGDLQPRTTR